MHFEFEKFKDNSIDEDGSEMNLGDIKLEEIPEKQGTIAKFFRGEEEQEFEYYKGKLWKTIMKESQFMQ